MGRSLGIVVPAYDPDADRLAAYVESLRDLEPAAIRIELDATDESVRERLAALPATVNAVERRRGKGAAITAGFEALETDVYAFVDADGSTPAGSLADVVAAVEDGADLAVGSRRHPRSSVRNSQSRVRESAGDLFAWVGRRALPVALYDYQCGAKAITADAWERVRTDLYDPGFAWDVDLVAAAGRRGLDVREVPIEWEDRQGTTVPLVRTGAALGRAILRARRYRRPGADDRPLPDRSPDHD